MMTTTTDPVARNRLMVLAIGVSVVAIDAATKEMAIANWSEAPVSMFGGLLRLTESRNPGAAFGLATSATPVLAIIAAVVVVGVVVLSRRVKTLSVALALGLILGGASGNLMDRLFRPPGPFRGYVVDWIDIGAWPNFNLADACLVTASILLVMRTAVAKPSHTPSA